MIKEQISDFLNYLNYEKKYSSNTLRAYTKDLNDFILFIEKESIKSLIDIKKQHIHQFLYFLSLKKHSERTVARKLAAIKSLFNFLIRKNFLKNNIVKSIASPKIDKKLPVFLTQDKMSLLLQERDFYKPFNYAWAYEAYKTQNQMHWIPDEVNLADDLARILCAFISLLNPSSSTEIPFSLASSCVRSSGKP